MNTIFETEDREERMERQDSEVTLSTGTLLAIFFGLVVVCGVFFGFGYSMGRHSSDAKAAAAQVAAAPAAEEAASAPNHPKPSALELLPAPTAQAGTPGDDPAPRTVVVDQSGAAADSANSEPAVKTAPKTAAPRPAVAQGQQPLPSTETRPQPAPKLVTASSPSVTPPRSTPASLAKPATKSAIMVQIAAISHPEDAEALVAALKKRGYAVAVHTEPQDKLLHVQVGPFATREDAVAMRQKLLSDGYNAIIK